MLDKMNHALKEAVLTFLNRLKIFLDLLFDVILLTGKKHKSSLQDNREKKKEFGLVELEEGGLCLTKLPMDLEGGYGTV